MSGRQTRPEELEAWAAFVLRIVAFVFGMLLISFDVTLMAGEPVALRLAVLFSGVAMMGPTIAKSLSGLLSSARSGE